jgi:hypothetical protein
MSNYKRLTFNCPNCGGLTSVKSSVGRDYDYKRKRKCSICNCFFITSLSEDGKEELEEIINQGNKNTENALFDEELGSAKDVLFALRVCQKDDMIRYGKIKEDTRKFARLVFRKLFMGSIREMRKQKERFDYEKSESLLRWTQNEDSV